MLSQQHGWLEHHMIFDCWNISTTYGNQREGSIAMENKVKIVFLYMHPQVVLTLVG